MSKWRGKGLRQFTVSFNEKYTQYLFDMIEQGRCEGFSDAFRLLIDKDRGVTNPQGFKLTRTQAIFLKVLGKGEKHIDDLEKELGWKRGTVLATAYDLDERGIIDRPTPKTYRKTGLVNIE